MPSLHGGGARYVALDATPPYAHSPLRFRYYGSNTEAYPDLCFRYVTRRMLEPDGITYGFLRGGHIDRLIDGLPRLYDRIYRDSQRPTSHSDDSLICLGRRIASTSGSYPRPDQPCFPAAYNYLGQFIAHDLSYLMWNPISERAHNLTSPALDLSSIIPNDIDTVASHNTIGPTSKNRMLDLPRAPCGRTTSPDERNDSNLALAQVHVMISRFFEVVRVKLRLSDLDARHFTKLCFQHMVLCDYLVRVVGEDLIDDITCNGYALVKANPFLPSVEFSAACFQFGHSMIRDSYDQWHEGDDAVQYASAAALLEHTHLGSGLARARGIRVLSDNWVLPWNKMLSGSDDGACPPHNSFAITAGIINALASIPAQFVQQPLGRGINVECGDPDTTTSPVNLAVQTLLRGAQLELPSGQQLTEVVNNKLRGHTTRFKPIPCLTLDQIWRALEPCNPALLAFLEGDGRHLLQEVPLWLYTLLESKAKQCHGILGPLAARIVAETVHAAIAEDDRSVLNVPFEPSDYFEMEGRQFGLRAMLAISQEYESLFPEP